MTNPHPIRENGLPGIDSAAARITWTAALTLLTLAAIYAIRGTLVVFAVALLFAYLLYPLVESIGRRFPARHRDLALALTYLLVLGILAAGAILAGSRLVFEVRQLVAHPPDISGFLTQLRNAHPALSPVIDAAQGRIRQQFGDVLSAAPRYALSVLAASANLLDLVIIPILAFFMVKDSAKIRENLLDMFAPGPSRTDAERTLAEVHSLLLSYMRALLLLCCNVLVVFSIVLSLIGVQYALLLSSFAFLCEFVPLLGPVTAAGVILLASALTGFPHILWVLSFLAGFRLLQDYVLSPKLMGGGVELHPLLVIFGVFAGGDIGGVAGIFLSIPVLALGRLIVERLRASK